MNETQIGALVTGLGIMFFFGYGWSLETLRAKQGLYHLIKTGNRHLVVIVLHFLGFLIGLVLVVVPNTSLSDILLTKNTDNKKEDTSSYVLFLDTSVIKNEGNKIDKRALLILNGFLERTKAKIVVISNDRFHRSSLINHKIEVLKLICANYGIRGTVIGSIPYTKGVYTRHQEIGLWYKATKIKFDNCAVIDKAPYSFNNIVYTINVDKLLTSRHLLAVVKVFETVHDPKIFNIRTQKYDEFFKSRKQVSG